MESIEDALAWLFTKSEDEIIADVEISAWGKRVPERERLYKRPAGEKARTESTLLS